MEEGRVRKRGMITRRERVRTKGLKTDRYGLRSAIWKFSSPVGWNDHSLVLQVLYPPGHSKEFPKKKVSYYKVLDI
jgi:hypothetical protein